MDESQGAVTHLGARCQLVSKTQARSPGRSSRAQEQTAHIFISQHPKEYQGTHSEISLCSEELDFLE